MNKNNAFFCFFNNIGNYIKSFFEYISCKTYSDDYTILDNDNDNTDNNADKNITILF
jgi:hypothetical protein